jgi:hypothetical protein
MSTAPIEQQQNDSKQLAEATRLHKELRSMRGQLEIEQQQALVARDTAKSTTIRLALKKSINKKSADTIIQHLADIEQGKSSWQPSVTRPLPEILDAMGEAINDGSKVGQDWIELLRTYKVSRLPTNPLFNR